MIKKIKLELGHEREILFNNFTRYIEKILDITQNKTETAIIIIWTQQYHNIYIPVGDFDLDGLGRCEKSLATALGNNENEMGDEITWVNEEGIDGALVLATKLQKSNNINLCIVMTR